MLNNGVLTAATQTELRRLRQLFNSIERLADDNAYQAAVPSIALERVQKVLPSLLATARCVLDEFESDLAAQEREQKQLQALQEVGALVNSSLELADVLNMVMDTIISLTAAERGFLMLIDEETGELSVQVARNINRETILDRATMEYSRSVVESVFETGVPVVTTNAQVDPRFSFQHSIINYSLRSILCVPIKIKSVILGVIYADNRIAEGIFTKHDRDLLAAFANQAAVAIENARLFRQIRDQLANITEMKYLMDNVFESMASGVITIDTNDRISTYNRAAEQLLNIQPRQALDATYQEIFVGISGIVRTMVEQVKAHETTRYVEVDAQLGEQQNVTSLALNCAPLRDMQRETLGVAIVVDDVSEKKRLESVRRYLPPALVDQVRNIDAAQRPQRQEMSIFFADVRGFSTFSEFLSPEELIMVINQYFTVASQAIIDYEGVIDKFMGDAVMALFNTPLIPQPDHVERAVRTGLAMKQGLKALHRELPESQRLVFGIGVHTGEAVVGNVGSRLRKDYSALGDAVNLAKRIQDYARDGQFLISAETYQRVRSWVRAKPLGLVTVKGRETPVQIYEVLE